jgi:hypothetical protein
MCGLVERVLRVRHGRTAAVLSVLSLALAGCSSLSTPASSWSAFVSSVKPQIDANASAPPGESSFECPSINIRSGASTYAVSADPKDSSALNLRYQVSIAETARECKLVAGTVTMRIGVQGRVVVGPAGGPGTVDVPLRFAVVQETVDPKTIMSKLERVSVTINQNDPNVLFTHVEEGVSFPMPRGNAIDYYVVYIGFDPLGARELEKKRPAPRRTANPRRPT